MYISKIKLLGFKSFSDETNLSFDNQLNGIIGPNGAGKSNVVEAIKWVMGENSSKSLRGSGMNDIIFSGSTTKASKNIAAVTLFLNVGSEDISSSCKKFIKSGTIEVERQIIRDTGSTYKINGKEVRAKDVQFLFADLSSGSRASNIIDQGSVGNLITQKPAERRKILDEAAGISGISARKTESINKLEATKRNLARLADILLDNKDRLSTLKKQATTAQKYKEANNKIIKLSQDIAFAKLQKAILQKNKINENLEEVSYKYSEKSKSLDELEIQKTNIGRDLEKLAEENNIINQDNLNKINIIEKINIEISNNSKQLESLKNLKEQINKNQGFQNEILENSLTRLNQLKGELLSYNNFSKNKNYKNAEEEYTKLQKELLISNELLEQNTFKLTNKKELVTNKEYQKQLLQKNLVEIKDELNLLKATLNDKEKKYKNTDYFLGIEKNKSNITNKKKQTKVKLEKEKKKLIEFNKLLDSASLEKNKLIVQINQQNEKIYDIKNQISVYSSLGFKNTEKNIIKKIVVDKNYELAFYLALGDGIESSNDKESSVVWNNLNSSASHPLPANVTPAYKYVNGPKEIQLFLSQLGIVNNKEDGNKYQRNLKPGQVLVSKNGELWRWDGLYIKDGRKTITYKRITSTTKLIELEKILNNEDDKINKLREIKIRLDKKFSNIEADIKEITKKIHEYESLIMSNNDNLVEIEKELLQKINKKDIHLEEINKTKDLINSKTMEEKNIRSDMKLLEDLLIQESGEIVNIKKVVSIKNKENLLIKSKFENYRIEFEINKKQIDEEIIKKEKIDEEINATEKQIKNTQSILSTLNDDIKKADYEENMLLSKPNDSEVKIKELDLSIELNKNKLKNLEKLINQKKSKLELVLQKYENLKNKLEGLKEDNIRKETQFEQLESFIKSEVERIEVDLRITNEAIYNTIGNKDYSNIDIKSEEINLRILKNKIDSIDDINLSAEKELVELESKINDILIEEKDLNNAAKKLERAIEELNKEARNRVLNTFTNINNTFSDLFKKLFDGGKAYLELTDSEDPLEAGLELMVSPPGKKLQRISLLSGGEKALASLALIFSTFINKHTPICILDEVDAPLDDFNVERFCNLLKETSQITSKKFLVITHNKITMGYMNKIYGVTMNEPGVSKLVSVNLDKVKPEYAAE